MGNSLLELVGEINLGGNPIPETTFEKYASKADQISSDCCYGADCGDCDCGGYCIPSECI